MGVGQQSTAGLATTMLAAGAMVGKVSADIDKANVAKAAEADKLQENFLQNKEAISNLEGEHKNLQETLDAALYGEGDVKEAAKQQLEDKYKLTDKQAAERALNTLKEKHQALGEMNERIGKRFQKLTHTPIIGGDK